MRLFLLFSLMLFSTFSIAQIQVIENFDSFAGVPAEWHSIEFDDDDGVLVCSEGISLWSNLAGNNPSNELATPYQAGASNGTDLSINFDLKVVNWSFWDGQTPVADGWGTIDVEYTTDSVTWKLLETISDQNYTSSVECTTRSYTVEADSLPEGSNFQFRLSGHHLAGSYFMIVDNFNIVQEATTIPNCDAPLTSPANGETDVELEATINWSYSSGLASGYKITIGSASGGNDIADNVDVGNAFSYTPAVALEYNTTYYVTILSYNAFGDAVDCTEQTFTTRMPPPPGASCEAPIVISEFPFHDTNTNAGFDNDYQESPCNNTYIKGLDVVYAINTTEEMSINITFDSIVGNRAAIHVLDGCPDVAENCLAYFGAFNPQPQYFENLILEANHTYYIVIATSIESSIIEYDLEVTQNPCVIPDATFTSMEDCENGQYYVDVDITRMGSAESLTIADDQGSDVQVVDSLGIATFGPYPSGTLVNFTVTNDQDDYCVITGSREFYCNDYCFAATPLPVNPDQNCTEFGSGTLIEATVASEDPPLCDQTVAKDVWFSFVATNSIHTIELYNIVALTGFSTSTYFEVLEGNCGSLNNLMCSSYPYNNVGNLTIGNTYLVRVFNPNANTTTAFDICVSTPPDAPENDICAQAIDLPISTDENCDNMITGTTISALQTSDNTCSGNYNEVWYALNPENTGYYHVEFEVTSGTAQTNMSYWTGECGALEQASSCSEKPSMIVYAVAGESQYVMIRTQQGSPGVVFNLCAYRVFPPANNSCNSPVLFMESQSENGEYLVIDNNEGASHTHGTGFSNTYEDLWYTFTPNFTGEYYFDFTKISGGSGYYTIYEDSCEEFVYVSGITSAYNTGDKVINVIAGNAYKVAVHSPSPVYYQFFVYPVNPTPSNDQCATPDILTASTDGTCDNMVSGYTYSTHDSGDTDCGTDAYDVWYSFTPDSTGYYQFDLTQPAGDNDVSMTLYSGDCGSLSQESVNCTNQSMIQNLEAGINYTLMVASAANGGIAPGVEFDLCAYLVTPPANNDCEAAIVFEESATSAGENTITGTTEYATYSVEGCYDASFEGVWYSFTPMYTGQYTISFNSTSGEASYNVYAGTCGEFIPLMANCYNPVGVSLNFEAGTVYTFSVQSESMATFEFFVYPDLLAPDNNSCETPLTIAESSDENCDNMISGTTLGAVNSATNPCSDSDLDVWYAFTPANDGYYQFDLSQTSGTSSSYMALFNSACGDLGMEGDSCQNTSMIQQLTGGETYTLMVASDSTTLGVDFDLCVYQYFPPANNDCISAETFTESADSTGNNLVMGTNEGAFYSSEACYEETYQGVWYTFTPTYTGTYEFDFTSLSGDASYTIYSGDCEMLEYAEGISDCYNTGNSMIVTEAGATYIISVHAQAAATYEFFAYPTEIVSTDDISEELMTLRYYPNPVTGNDLFIEADYEMSNIEVFNALGQRVMVVRPQSMNEVVNISQLQTGIYFIEVRINGATRTFKVIRQ